MTSIELSFGSSNGGAWDDRELVKAYDAAVDEFHVRLASALPTLTDIPRPITLVQDLG